MPPPQVTVYLAPALCLFPGGDCTEVTQGRRIGSAARMRPGVRRPRREARRARLDPPPGYRHGPIPPIHPAHRATSRHRDRRKPDGIGS